MALLHKKGWLLDKEPTQLALGYHYDQHVRSIVIPEGQQVTFYENEDRQGFKSRTFYEGEYLDISFHGAPLHPGVVHVEKTDLTRMDMIQVEDDRYWTDDKGKKHTFIMIWKLPIGQRKHGDDFPNDVIDRIKIPFGVTVEAFDDGNFKGGSLFFSGTDPDGYTLIYLKDRDYQNKVSSMIITSDEWEPAGIELRNERIVDGNDKKLGGTVELANNIKKSSNPDPELAAAEDVANTAVISKEITFSTQKTTETRFDTALGIAVSVGFEAGYDNNIVAKATGNLEISAEVAFGKSQIKTEQVDITETVEAPVSPESTVKISMWAERGKMIAEAIRKFRNKRSGAIIEQEGEIIIDHATRTLAEVH